MNEVPTLSEEISEKPVGWLNIYKPRGLNSTKAVSLVKRTLPKKYKIGHAGTLDPMAEGVLPIAIGHATRLTEYLQDLPKTYQFSVVFGSKTTTGDAEGEVIATSNIFPTGDQIAGILPKFTGEIVQTPPAYSAIRINGRRAYDLAREGVEFEIKQRSIFVHSINILKIQCDEVTNLVKVAILECCCSKGTYIRSIAQDIAENLGSVAHVDFLKRTKYGPFSDNVSFDGALLSEQNLIESLHILKKDIMKALLPLDVVLDDIPVIHLKEEKQVSKLVNGMPIEVVDINSLDGKIHRVYFDNLLICMAKYEDKKLKPEKVFK